MKLITAFFTNRGVPATGLTPLITIYQHDVVDPTQDFVVVNQQAMDEIGNGLYRFTFTQYNPLNNYSFFIDGGSSLHNTERYQHGGNESFIEEITSRVWTTDASSPATGTYGELINNNNLQLQYITNVVQLLMKYESNRSLLDPQAGTLTIFDDDGVTPLIVFDLYDVGGTPPTTRVVEKIPR